MTTALIEKVGTRQILLAVLSELQVAKIHDDVQRAMLGALRVKTIAAETEINNAEDAGAAADVIKVAKAASKKLVASRLEKTRPLDDVKSKVMEVYAVPGEIIDAAVKTLTEKISVFRAAEQRRQAEEAAKLLREREAQAAALAKEQAAAGDVEGAQRIIEEAAALPPPETKVVVVGSYGASLSTRNRAVGVVKNKVQFLSALLRSEDPRLTAVLDSVEFSTLKLNQLAKAVRDGEVFPVAGFEATEVTNDVIL